MRVGSVFSGAGMLDAAALELFPGSRVAWHSEVDPAASKVLAHHFPGVPNLGDITRVDWSIAAPIDVLVGGFPCVDVSSAGKRAGLKEGTRSGLWSYMRDAIEALQPRYVLAENVRGLLSADAVRDMESDEDDLGNGSGGPVLRALGAVLGDLADVGFDADWTLLRASDIGFCHHRARVFILAYPADTDSGTLRQQPESEPGRGRPPLSGLAGEATPDTESDGHARLDDSPVGTAARHAGVRDVAGSVGGDAVSVVARPGRWLPTPRASDGTKGGPNQRGSSGDLMLPSAVMQMLPTPKASDAGRGDCQSERDRRSPSLVSVQRMLPTPTARLGDSRGASHPDVRKARNKFRSGELDEVAVHIVPTAWGDYEAAIRRQESFTRPAPSPVEPNRTGNPRLAAPFAEWMQGWPEGWVTDPAIGLTRNEQLKCVGNGVIPMQAVAAFRHLLSLEPLELPA